MNEWMVLMGRIGQEIGVIGWKKSCFNLKFDCGLKNRNRGSYYTEKKWVWYARERKSHEGIQVRNEHTFSAWFCINASKLWSSKVRVCPVINCPPGQCVYQPSRNLDHNSQPKYVHVPTLCGRYPTTLKWGTVLHRSSKYYPSFSILCIASSIVLVIIHVLLKPR